MSKTKKKKANNELHLVWCGMCQAVYVKCPLCGNNSCSGAYGRVNAKGEPIPWNSKEEGTPCPLCEKTYELMYKLESTGCMKLVEELIPDKHMVTQEDLDKISDKP